MSGHSKWSQIKHQKGAADLKRGQVFTKLGNAIAVAIREGGGIADANANFKLRLAIEKAREANMPKANIDRAIERGLGKGEGLNLEELTYEGFGPGKVAILVQAVTDNRQRTNSNLKNLFANNGGNLSGRGSVSYLFQNCGEIKVERENKSDDEYMEIALAVGSIDMEIAENFVSFFTQPKEVHKIKEAISQKGMKVVSAELIFRPTTKIKIEDKKTQEKIIHFLEELKNNDDIHKVSANFDF